MKRQWEKERCIFSSAYKEKQTKKNWYTRWLEKHTHGTPALHWYKISYRVLRAQLLLNQSLFSAWRGDIDSRQAQVKPPHCASDKASFIRHSFIRKPFVSRSVRFRDKADLSSSRHTTTFPLIDEAGEGNASQVSLISIAFVILIFLLFCKLYYAPMNLHCIFSASKMYMYSTFHILNFIISISQ